MKQFRRTSMLDCLVRVAFTCWAACLADRVRGDLLTFPDKPVDGALTAFMSSITALHQKAIRSGKPWREEQLRRKVPRKYLGLEKRYIRLKNPSTKARALAQLALVQSELAWTERIRPIAESLKELDRDLADRLGHFEESEHFLARVVGTEPKWGKAAVKLGEAARAGYLKLFGFRSISKVPGKKIRILIHVDPAFQRPRLYFHPSPPFHSELRYEVPDEKSLTLAGRQRIVYGFCHELGHMVAMWGKYRVVEDDKHAWAHYTGCLVVEEVYQRLGNQPWPTWTSFQRRASGVPRLLKQIEGKKAGVDSHDSILALFYAVGKEFGTDVYGRGWLWLEKKKRFRRLNRVPYLWLKDLKESLYAVVPRQKASRIREIFGEGRGSS